MATAPEDRSRRPTSDSQTTTGVVIPFPQSSTIAPALEAATPPAPEAIRRTIRAERERVARIMSHSDAVGLEQLALHLAVATDFTVDEAAVIFASARKNAEDSSQSLTAFTADQLDKYFPTLN